ncbi:LysR family transcriptional regulator [Halalkalibacter hemicellulosilyticus]|uniref:Transcription activator of glutamate synthase operon n=1 Tax=Halalkalibacter hemicellulosilyticusJCM 9152 TaxID=1236971 RepID=W4QKW2_9BACI|nr:LysR family transcriptional regulator [Halalkalibacter hemicellulosilyticus]GAE32731.1 transcription activator of glutamate synthase operon [Halalkalibacter hemicellulosilyticusJCM 9152]
MELRQLKYFMEVAKREHMTEAAEALHVAQSAVSRQIGNLEDELGVDLFVRQGRRVKLTPLGRIFLERTTEAMKLIESATREVEEHLEPEKGTVRITFPISMAAFTLPTAISRFRQKYPQAKFQLKQGIYYNLIEDVVNGEYNMALLAPVPEDERVEGYTLFTEEVVAIVPKTHTLSTNSDLSLKQLENEPLVVLPEGMYFRELVIQACLDQGYYPNISFEGDDVDALKGLASAGLGITLLPEVTVMDNVPHNTVKIRIRDPKVIRTVGIITPKGRELLPTERLFLQFLKEFFENTVNV